MIRQHEQDRIDAVIVGAGAAGNLYAAVLAEAGKSVLVLDPGPDWKAADLYSSSIWSRRLRWAGQRSNRPARMRSALASTPVGAPAGRRFTTMVPGRA